MKLGCKLFIEQGKEFSFGPGRLRLLRDVARLGSLRQAAILHGMSYRWAWGKIRESEKILGVALLQRDRQRAVALTAEAIDVLAWFDSIEPQIDTMLATISQTMPECLRDSVKN